MSIKRTIKGIRRIITGIRRTGVLERTPVMHAPGVPTFSLTNRDASIELQITRGDGGRPSGYRYQVRRRNPTDTDWTAPQTVDLAGVRNVIITNYSTTIPIANGERYEIRVLAYNDIGSSVYSAYMEITPMEIHLAPGIPTFTLGIDPDSVSDAIITPTGNSVDTLPITHWIIRHRVKGTTAWNEEVVTAGDSSYTFDGSSNRGMTLEFQIAARNSIGDSEFTATQEVRFIDVPSRPDLFLTAQPGGFDVRIVTPPSGDPATATMFRYREGTAGSWTPGTVLEVRGLKGNTLYQVEAWSVNNAGRGLSVSRTVTTLEVMRILGQAIVYGNNMVVYGNNNIPVYGG